MQTSQLQVVFALTSSGTDIYAIMTRIAIASLRHSNPDVRIQVASDRKSSLALHRARNPLVDEADVWLDLDTPPGGAAYRNRHVKTSLREVISGSFLFLDSDVFVRGKLEQIFRIEGDIAAAPNYSQHSIHRQIPQQDAAMLAALDWQISTERYVNGGVIFYNDTEGARKFASAWHERWKHSSQHLRHFRDQPALNAALHEVQPKMYVLQHEYNFQMKWNTDHVEQPVIWHYNYTSQNEVRTSFETYADELHRGASLDMRRITELAGLGQP